MSLEVVKVLGLATVQDLGMHGCMHEALPPGGALVLELLAWANRAVGNTADALGIEVLGRLVLRATQSVSVAVDDQPARTLAPGEEIEIASGARRCAYLAVRGGLQGPLWRDRRRGTVVSAGIGAPLIVGAMVAIGERSTMTPTTGTTPTTSRFVESENITIIAGPDLDAFTEDALAVLASAPYRILPASNRVGTRLAGPALPRRAGYRERSRPMVQGALEVPRDGQPIVLGPEHPTTGGYPVIGVIASAELGRFHAIRLGGSVRFIVR